MQALDVDKDIIRELVIQGLKVRDIAARYGVNPKTIQSWINRHGWKHLAERTVTVMQQTTTQPLLSDQVAKASIATRTAFAATLSELSDKVAGHKSKSLKSALALQEQLEPAMRNAERLFRWADASVESMVSSRKLSSFEPLPDPAPSTPIELASDSPM
jgi:uncharacterized protein YjcR